MKVDSRCLKCPDRSVLLDDRKNAMVDACQRGCALIRDLDKCPFDMTEDDYWYGLEPE